MRLANIRDLGVCVTDRCPSEPVRRIATEAGVRIVEALPGEEAA